MRQGLARPHSESLRLVDGGGEAELQRHLVAGLIGSGLGMYDDSGHRNMTSARVERRPSVLIEIDDHRHGEISLSWVGPRGVNDGVDGAQSAICETVRGPQVAVQHNARANGQQEMGLEAHEGVGTRGDRIGANAIGFERNEVLAKGDKAFTVKSLRSLLLGAKVQL